MQHKQLEVKKDLNYKVIISYKGEVIGEDSVDANADIISHESRLSRGRELGYALSPICIKAIKRAIEKFDTIVPPKNT